jgi:hypothetical protein
VGNTTSKVFFMEKHLIVSYNNHWFLFSEKFKSQQEKFVTPTRSKKALAKNSDSKILTSLDVNMFDTPSPSAQVPQQKKTQSVCW